MNASKRKKFAVRLMAWILAILMVVSITYFAAVLIVDNVRTARAEKEKAEQEQNGGTEDEDDHDHDHDHETYY